MKFLAVLFLAGLALASAVPLQTYDSAADVSENEIDDFYYNLALHADDNGIKTELGNKLKERFDEILNKIREAIEKGNVVKEDTIEKLKELREKLRDLKVDLGSKLKDLLDRLKEKGRDYFKQILDKLGLKDKRSVYESSGLVVPDALLKLKERFEKRFEKRADDIKKMSERGEEVTQKIISELTEAADDYQEISRIYGFDGEYEAYEIEGLRKFAQKLKNRYEGFSKQIKETKEKGEEVSQELLDRFVETVEDWKEVSLLHPLYSANNELQKRERSRRDLGIPDALKKLKERFKQHFQNRADDYKEARLRGEENTSELIKQFKEAGEDYKEISRIYGFDGKYEDFEIEGLRKFAQKLKDRYEGFSKQIKETKDRGEEVSKKLIDRFLETVEDWKEVSLLYPLFSENEDSDLQKRERSRRDLVVPEALLKLKEKFKRRFEKRVEEIRETSQRGEKVTEELINKMKEALADYQEISRIYGFDGEYDNDEIEGLRKLVKKFKDRSDGLTKQIREMIDRGEEVPKELTDRFLETVQDWKELSLLYPLLAPNEESDLKKRLREQFDELLLKLKDALEQGKTVKESTLEKLKEIREQLKDLKVDLSDRAKEILANLKTKLQDYWHKILDRLKGDAPIALDPKTELGKKLKEHLDEILEKLKDAFENGKVVKEETIEKLKEIREKLKELKIDIGEKAKDLLNQLKEKAKDYWKKILDKLTGNEFLYFAAEPKTELGKKLKEHFNELLQKIKDDIDSGKVVKAELLEKLEEVREQLRDLKIDLGERAKELLKQLKEKAKDYWKKILDRITGNDDSLYYADDDNDEKKELEKTLKEALDHILERIKDAIDNGKAVKEDTLNKLREIREKLKDMNVELGNKAKELIEKIKDRAKDYWKRILEKLGLDKRSIDLHLERTFEIEDMTLAERFIRLLNLLRDRSIDLKELEERIFQLFGRNSESNFSENIVKILQERGEEGRNYLIDYVETALKGKRSVKDVWEKIKNYFKDLNIDLKEKFTKFGEWVKNQYEKGLEKGKDKLENVKRIAKEFLEDSKQISKDVAEEALEFFREYKEDLGKVFEDIKEKVKKTLKE